MMRLNKAVGLAAVAVCAAAGVASAATVDVFYRFGSSYDVNCTGECLGTEFGEFELRMSYDDVEVLDPGLSTDFVGSVITYNGPTTVDFVTPVGSASFAAMGQGRSEFLVYPSGGAIFSPSESLDSADGSEFFGIRGITSFIARDAISSGQGGLFSYEFGDLIDEGTDIDTYFQFLTDGGDTITGFGEYASTVYAVSYQLSDDTIPAPSPVPLPASAPLLLAGMGALGLWSRRRKG